MAGEVEEQEPLHWIDPLACVWPQALAVEVQTLPYPAGLAGVEAEQAPLQVMVPVFVCPQELALDVQDCPEFAVQQDCVLHDCDAATCPSETGQVPPFEAGEVMM